MFSSKQFFALLVSGVYFAGAAVLIQRQTLPANCDRDFEVRLFDTCDGISALVNVSTYQLATVNVGLINSDCSNLAQGEDICLGITGQDCNITHVVQSGDGCDTITTAAGIPFSTLIANNPNVNEECTNIYPGEVLCVASQIFVTSPGQ